MPPRAKAETPVSATYYPHTSIKTEGLLKTALLLWDKIECVLPSGPSSVPPERTSKRFAKAAELVVKHRRPTSDEKQRVHARLSELLRDGVPAWLRQSEDGSRPSRPHYLIYPDKLAGETWSMLQHHGLAAWDSMSSDYGVPPALGLLCMSILADECAGVTSRRVTDRTDAYTWLARIMTTDAGGEYLPSVEASHLATTYDRLVTVSLETLGAGNIPLTRLVEMRAREAKGGSNDYRQLRLRYLKNLDTLVARVTSKDMRPSDVKEVERAFKADMKDDLATLKSELRLNSAKALLSKEVGLFVVAAASTIAFPISLPAVAASLKGIGVGALLKNAVEFRGGRRKILRDHAMSWVYVASGS